jgi:hypothetical protein
MRIGVKGNGTSSPQAGLGRIRDSRNAGRHDD